MINADDQILADRAAKVSAVWPTLTEALGCLDCGYLVRHAIGESCPLCGSRGEMLNVAEFFNDTRVKNARVASTDLADAGTADVVPARNDEFNTKEGT